MEPIQKIQQTAPFLKMPQDIRNLVMGRLDARSLALLGGACRETNRMVQNAQELWKKFLTTESYPFAITDWKKAYAKRALIRRNFAVRNMVSQFFHADIHCQHYVGDQYYQGKKDEFNSIEISFGNDTQLTTLSKRRNYFAYSFSGPFACYLESTHLVVYNGSRLIFERHDAREMVLERDLLIYQDIEKRIYVRDLKNDSVLNVYHPENKWEVYIGAIGKWIFFIGSDPDGRNFLNGFNIQTNDVFSSELFRGTYLHRFHMTGADGHYIPLSEIRELNFDECTFSQNAITISGSRHPGPHLLEVVHLNENQQPVCYPTDAFDTIIAGTKKISLYPGVMQIFDLIAKRTVFLLHSRHPQEEFSKMLVSENRLILSSNQNQYVWNLDTHQTLASFGNTFGYQIFDHILYVKHFYKMEVFDLFDCSSLGTLNTENRQIIGIHDGRIICSAEHGTVVFDLLKPLPSNTLYGNLVRLKRFFWG